MDQKENRNEIKKFLIKLAAITFAIIIIINVTYNLILADKMENLNTILSTFFLDFAIFSISRISFFDSTLINKILLFIA